MRNIDYQIVVGEKGETHVDIDIVPSDLSVQYDFTLLYKRSLDSDYVRGAVLSCQGADFISDGFVSGVSGRCTVRWHFSQNDLLKSDGLSIEIRPEPRVDVIVESEGSDVRVRAVLGGSGNISLSTVPNSRVVSLVDHIGGDVYWNGSLIITALSPDHISVGKFSGEMRIFTVVSADFRVSEYETDGTLVQTYSGIFGGIPVTADYNDVSGDIVVLLSSGNFVAVKWKDPSSLLESHASAGTVFFDYAVDIGGVLSGIQSVTTGNGSSTAAISTATQVAVVDMDTLIETVYDSASFETPIETSSAADMTLDGILCAFDGGNGRIVAIKGGGDELLSANSALTHETFNRSSGKNARYDYHSSLSNDIFRPISPRETLTFEMLNHDEIMKSAILQSESRENASYLRYAKYHRGNIMTDVPIRGFSESYVRGGGISTLVAMTGQTVRCSIPETGLRIGYYVDGDGISPAYVSETADIVVTNLSTGAQEITTGVGLQGGYDFSIVMPHATEASYTRSLVSGCHHVMNVEFSVRERYYSDTSMVSEVAESSIRKYHVVIVVMWWRQIFKDSYGQMDSVLSGDIDLANYSELAHDFFNTATVLPEFYKMVGTDAVEPTDSQKANIILENAFAVLTYSTGICIGDSPVSPVFSTNPKPYVKGDSPWRGSPFESGVQTECDSPMYGLNADYQTVATFSDHPAIQLTADSAVRNMASVLYLDGGDFAGDRLQNGMCVIPGGMQVISSMSTSLSGNEQLAIDYGNEFQIDGIGIYGDFSMSRPPRIGDKIVAVDFSVTSGTPESIFVGFSLNGGTPSVFDSAPYEFDVDPLSDGDHLSVFIRLGTVNDFETFSENYVVTDGNSLVVYGVKVRDDKRARTLHLDYSLYADHDYVPATVSVSMTIGGSPVSQEFIGDVGMVYPRYGKTASVRYYDTPDTSLSGISVVTITATSPVHGAALGENSINFYLRTPDFETRRFDTPAFIALTKESALSARISDSANVKDKYVVIEDVGNYNISGVLSSSGSPSSSSSSYSSSSSQSFSSSSSPSSSCSSSSCSSSSS